MSKHVAFLCAAAAWLGAALPGGASAADYYDGGNRPLAFHSRDDVYVEGGRARVEHSQDLRPADVGRRAPGPVAFDERGPDRRYDRPGYGFGAPGDRGPVERPGYGYGYRPAAMAVGPAFGGGYGGPDEGCTVERARSVTPAGWEKTVTHRTCYRR